MTRVRTGEQGIAMIVALFAMLLMSALGLVLVMATRAEPMIAANFHAGLEAVHAADAAVARTLEDLFAVENWPALLAGAMQSRFVDGVPSGQRRLRDGTVVDLQVVRNLANCGQSGSCSEAALQTTTAARPWGANNPRWQLYAYGTLPALIGTGTIASSLYVVVMVADDPAENDGAPLEDGGEPADGSPINPGTGVLMVRGLAFGPRGARAGVEVTVARTEDGVHMRSWRPLDGN